MKQIKRLYILAIKMNFVKIAKKYAIYAIVIKNLQIR